MPNSNVSRSAIAAGGIPHREGPLCSHLPATDLTFTLNGSFPRQRTHTPDPKRA